MDMRADDQRYIDRWRGQMMRQLKQTVRSPEKSLSMMTRWRGLAVRAVACAATPKAVNALPPATRWRRDARVMASSL